jgi:FemAB-related protein (PEP-CTERM system-associated)
VKSLSQKIDALKKHLAEAESCDTSSSPEKSKAAAAVADDQSSPGLFVPPRENSNNQEACVCSINEASECDAKDWDDYVRQNMHSSVYHFWFFRKVIEQTFNHVCHYFIARDANKRVCGILPSVELASPMFGHFIVSMPYFTYGGALALNEQVEQQLVSALIDKGRTLGVAHVEIRKTTKGLDGMQEKTGKVSMVRPLPKSKENFWHEVGAKVRAQVKKAARNNLTTKIGRAELLDDFYKVFATNMRDLGTPVYPKRFFENLLANDVTNEFSIGVTYDGASPVAGCFLMGCNQMREIPWASSLRSAASKNANMAMYAAVLDDTIERGYQFFDFGRSSPDAGTYRFKKQWGAKPMQLYWYYWLKDGGTLPELNPNNPKYKLLIAVWQCLPVWLSKLIGPHVVKYLP